MNQYLFKVTDTDGEELWRVVPDLSSQRSEDLVLAACNLATGAPVCDAGEELFVAMPPKGRLVGPE